MSAQNTSVIHRQEELGWDRDISDLIPHGQAESRQHFISIVFTLAKPPECPAGYSRLDCHYWLAWPRSLRKNNPPGRTASRNAAINTPAWTPQNGPAGQEPPYE
jgi:hypothetical protein